MPYLVGLDEAGYGPNLGPMVQSAVACWAPDATCLWQRLNMAVCRADEEPGSRLVFDDSKKVYAAKEGLNQLEHGALAILNGQSASSLGALLHNVAVEPSSADLAGEPWYQGEQATPAFVPADVLRESTRFIESTSTKQNVRWLSVRSLVTPARRFNALLDEFDSKGGVAIRGVAALVREVFTALPADDAVHFTIDKQGGRNYYAAMIQSAFPSGWVQAERESAVESRYRVDGLDRPVRLRFVPRAESESMTVAAASMFSKYLRELFMQQFNRFWAQRVPGLAPTAGYPVDAARFMNAIRPALAKLQISETDVWRRK